MASYRYKIFKISSVWILVLVVGLAFLPAWVQADSSKSPDTDSEIQKQEAIIISQSDSGVSGDSEKKEDSRENEGLEKDEPVEVYPFE